MPNTPHILRPRGFMAARVSSATLFALSALTLVLGLMAATAIIVNADSDSTNGASLSDTDWRVLIGGFVMLNTILTSALLLAVSGALEVLLGIHEAVSSPQPAEPQIVVPTTATPEVMRLVDEVSATKRYAAAMADQLLELTDAVRTGGRPQPGQ